MINIMLLYVFKEGASRKFKDFKPSLYDGRNRKAASQQRERDPEVCQRPEHHSDQRITDRTEPRHLQACLSAHQGCTEQDPYRPAYFRPETVSPKPASDPFPGRPSATTCQASANGLPSSEKRPRAFLKTFRRFQ